MPIVHTNPCNRELKCFLKRNHITYTDLAHASGYSKGTIDQWLIHPLSEYQQEIIKGSIEKIMKTHKVPALSTSCPNYEIRSKLMAQGISCKELSDKMGVRYQNFHQRLTQKELSSQQREMAENAIKEIGEERRLSHED